MSSSAATYNSSTQSPHLVLRILKSEDNEPFVEDFPSVNTFYTSFIARGYDAVEKYLTVTDQDNKATSTLKYVGATLADTALTLAGLVTSLVTNFVLILTKMVHFFLPNNEKVHQLLLKLRNQAQEETGSTLLSATRLFTRFAPPHHALRLETKIENGLDGFYGGDAADKIFKAQLVNFF